MARVTLQQIGRETGVTRATVSLAMHHHPSIPATTRNKILACAKRLGYRPNPLISALMADMRNHRGVRRTCTLAYVTPLPIEEMAAFPSARRYLAGATARAQELGYKLDCFPCRLDDQGRDPQLDRILLTRGIPGVLLAPSPGARYSIQLPWTHLCAATIGYTLQSPGLNRSINHQHHTLALAIRKCCEYGYRRLGFLLNKEDDLRVEHLWQGGFLLYQQTVPAADRIPIGYRDALPAGGLRSWLKKHRPDVMLVTSPLAIGELRAAGADIPRGLAVVLLDWSEGYRGTAGVDQRPDLVGAGGIDLVVQSLMMNAYGVPKSFKTVLSESAWVDGATLPRRPA